MRRLGVVVAFSLLVAGCGIASPCDVVIAGIPPDGPIPEEGGSLPDGVDVIVGPSDLDWAASSIGADQTGAPALNLVLRPAAVELFAIHTRANVGSYLALAINGEVVSVPVINSAIEDGRITIEGGGLNGLDVTPWRACVGR